MAAFCSSCGSALKDDVARFCPSCGAAVGGQTTAPMPSVPLGVAAPSATPQATVGSQGVLAQATNYSTQTRPSYLPIAATVASVLVGPCVYSAMGGYTHGVRDVSTVALGLVLVISSPWYRHLGLDIPFPSFRQ